MKLLKFLPLYISFISFGQIDHWEAVVREYDSFYYDIPSSSVDPSWKNIGFSNIGWATAPGGFGYGDGDDNTVVPNGTISVYQRIEFNITDTSQIDAAAFTYDYDDGFVAYLNGIEISRANLASMGEPPFNEQANGLHEADIYQSNYPSQFTLSKSFLESTLVNGLNCLAIQTHNESATSSDLTSRAYLHLGMTNTASTYFTAEAWFVPPIIFATSNLPIIVIETENNAVIPNDPKVNAVMGIINNPDGNLNSINDPYNEFYGNIGIETRGSSSGGFAKKSYGLETWNPQGNNLNTNIFNWPADNDWILYAPYSDKSLIRNVLTYKLGNELGEYAPRTQLCEVILNGDYQGVYVFMEKIKQGSGRVDVDKLEVTDIVNEDITGGYVFKIDKTTSGGIIAWTSPFAQAAPATGPISYQLHDPGIDTLHPDQLAYLEDYVTSFETALDGPNFTDPLIGYPAYIDVSTFIDFMIINEISKNVDGYRISTFYHKEHISDGGLMKAGPLWDFNLAWGNANYCDGGLTDGWEIYFNDVCGGGGGLNNPFHWNRLVQDPNFTHDLNCRWQELRQSSLHEDSLMNYIDELAVSLADAADRNFVRWPVLGTYLWPNNFVGNTYLEEIDYLKTWTSARLTWMDANMFGSCTDLGLTSQTINISVYPNPASNELRINVMDNAEFDQIQLTDLSGKIILSKKIKTSTIVNIDGVSSGIYLILIKNNNETLHYEKIIIQ